MLSGVSSAQHGCLSVAPMTVSLSLQYSQTTICGSYYLFLSLLFSLQFGQTPVYSASCQGHSAVVQLLIENGADISICNEVYSYIERSTISVVYWHHQPQYISHLLGEGEPRTRLIMVATRWPSDTNRY